MNHITMIGVKELGLILIFVSYSLGAGKYCSVDQDCAQNEVCSGVARDGDVAVKICMKTKMQRTCLGFGGIACLLEEMGIIPRKPCKNHSDCPGKLLNKRFCFKKKGQIQGVCKKMFRK